MAFEMYVNEGKTYLEIARHFDSLGIKPYRSKIWEKSSIRVMLKNQHYIGLVVYGSKKTERVYVDGELKKRRSRPADREEVVVAKGLHPAIVPQELFDAAQLIFDNNPRKKENTGLKNPLAGLIFCYHCGKALCQRPYPHARSRIECRNRNGCGSKSTFLDELIDAVAYALEAEQLPALEKALKNNDGQAAAIQKKQLEKLNKELEEMVVKEGRLLDFLESGTYTEEMFIKRNNLLQAQMEEQRSKIFECKQTMPKEVDYQEKIIKLKKAIAALRNDDLSIESKNKLLKAIVERIDFEFIERLGKGKAKYKLHIKLMM